MTTDTNSGLQLRSLIKANGMLELSWCTLQRLGQTLMKSPFG
jgi:hypothetical protein